MQAKTAIRAKEEQIWDSVVDEVGAVAGGRGVVDRKGGAVAQLIYMSIITY